MYEYIVFLSLRTPGGSETEFCWGKMKADDSYELEKCLLENWGKELCEYFGVEEGYTVEEICSITSVESIIDKEPYEEGEVYV